MKNQLLLLDDVDGVGCSGDIVSVKPGFARNYLFPQKKAVVAEKHLVRLQERLKAERAKKAATDKKDAEKLAKELVGKTLTTSVKIDANGHMYGSIHAQDIAKLFTEQLEIPLEKRNVVLPKPIKKLGTVEVELKLKEGVPAKITLEIKAEAEKKSAE